LQEGFLQRANSRQYHHVFPKAHMRGKPGAEEVNSVANIALIPADLNMRIGKKPPSTYLASYGEDNPNWPLTLRSHVIEGAAKRVLEDDEFLAFLEERAGLLSDLAADAVGSA